MSEARRSTCGGKLLIKLRTSLVFFPCAVVSRQTRTMLWASGQAAAALFDGQEAGLLPVQLVGVSVIHGLIIIPAHGAQGIEPVMVQTANVIGGVGAAVRDHQQTGGQRQMLLQELELFSNSAAAVALPVQALTEDR